MFGLRLVRLHEYAPVVPVPAVQLSVYVPDIVPHSIDLVGSSPPVSVIVAFPVAAAFPAVFVAIAFLQHL